MDAYGITEFRRVVREELASALRARGGGDMIEITVRLEPGLPMPGHPAVRRWQDGPVWHLVGEPEPLAEVLLLLGRGAPHGHVIDGRTKPPSVTSSKDVPSGCAKYIDADGNEDGPYCEPDLKDWIRDKLLGLARTGDGPGQAAF